jgi:hypothetical protein
MVNFCTQQKLSDGYIHFADELPTESVDDSGNGRVFALADEIKVQHALDCSGL